MMIPEESLWHFPIFYEWAHTDTGYHCGLKIYRRMYLANQWLTLVHIIAHGNKTR